MTAPALAAHRFLYSCLLGAALGLFYGFLRPLRPRRTLPADLAFLGAAVWAWVYLGFEVCGGDLRLGYTGGLFAGGLIFEWSLGWLLRPVFSGFWKRISVIYGKITAPAKKFFKFAKILFASGEKWVTIKCNCIRSRWRKRGGIPMEEKKNPLKNVKVVLRPSSPLLKIVVTVLIVFSMAALIALRWVQNSIRAQTENMRGEAAAVEQANSDLEEKIDDLGSVQSVQDIAREELGLVNPDTVFIDPN